MSDCLSSECVFSHVLRPRPVLKAQTVVVDDSIRPFQ